MEDILKIIEDRELYSHLILAKVYIGTKGKTNESFIGDIQKELKALFNSEFNIEMYRIALQYLYSENLVKYSNASMLTNEGRAYFESFIKNLQKANEEDIKLLNTHLPINVSKFLGLSSNIITVVDFLNKITNL